MSQSVIQCITVDLFPHILANVVDIQKVHLLLHTPFLNKTPRLSSARTFVRLYRLLLIHCIYVSLQNQHALPLVPDWILMPSDPWRWQEKLLCSVVTALPSKLCAALHGQSNVGSMCDCNPCRCLDLSVLVKILSGVDSDHGAGPRRNGSVNSRSTLCPIERQRRSFNLSSGCLRFVDWTISSCLTSQASKLHKLVAFYGVVKDRFFLTKSGSMKSATAFLPMSPASIRSLAMPGLAGIPKDKKYSSLSSKLEQKGLVKPETASSTHSSLHLSRWNISF